MNGIYYAFIVFGLAAVFVEGTLLVANTLIYPTMPLLGRLGFRCAFFTGTYWAVSRFWRTPLAIYWCGDTYEQQEKVAKAVALGVLPIKDYRCNNMELMVKSVGTGKPCWPDFLSYAVLGEPGNLYMPSVVRVEEELTKTQIDDLQAQWEDWYKKSLAIK